MDRLRKGIFYIFKFDFQSSLKRRGWGGEGGLIFIVNGMYIYRVMLTSVVGHWLTIQLNKVFMGKEKKNN